MLSASVLCLAWVPVDSATNLNASGTVGLGGGRFIVLPHEITGDVEMFKVNLVEIQSSEEKAGL